MSDCDFDLKKLSKQADPTWPRIMNLFTATESPLDLNLSKSGLQLKWIELISTCIGDNKIGQCNVRSINLS